MLLVNRDPCCCTYGDKEGNDARGEIFLCTLLMLRKQWIEIMCLLPAPKISSQPEPDFGFLVMRVGTVLLCD